ncbi:hypothetical protein CANINC_001250 [Pichia inconspicua]|uniref:Protein SOK1 n=1 Tax=Pichia inconspicua TaxID=52247 RepID=A0A4T0X422_9ASCO|nr:hypothetical protein CANINC_001250 [[Candida] inconspicua]
MSNQDTTVNTKNIVASESRRPSLIVTSHNNNNADLRHMTPLSSTPSSTVTSSNASSMKQQNQLQHEMKPIVESSTSDRLPSINEKTSMSKNFDKANGSLITKFKMLELPENQSPSIPVSSFSTNRINKISKNKPFTSKRYRSKSLPNIYIPSKSNTSFNEEFNINLNLDLNLNLNLSSTANKNLKKQNLLPNLLPPVNIHSMHEIDLQEVLKNPQLRHDILFDPQLQFRPNLDGERGRRKKAQSDAYWNMLKTETKNLMTCPDSCQYLNINSPIIIMFQSLKGILISLIPSKDISTIDEILDDQILIQQLNSKCFDFISFSNWICSIFKLHCAPMRDVWVDELNSLFIKACNDPLNPSNINIDHLIESFKTLFSILEAMKLDVANHQIRILRPLLCSSAVSFEKEYFKNAMKRNKINFTTSFIWFKKNANKLNSSNTREVLNYSILNLLSCSNMCSQFPNTLNFDHTRLLLLRAEIRHVVCTKLCFILYKILVNQFNLDKSLLSEENLSNFKNDLVSIVIDENGNSKWTKNLKNLSVQVVNKLFQTLDTAKIDFAYNWLLKQTQPDSSIYKILESKVFESISRSLSLSSSSTISFEKIIEDTIVESELKNIIQKLNQLIEFNFEVFGELYSSYGY